MSKVVVTPTPPVTPPPSPVEDGKTNKCSCSFLNNTVCKMAIVCRLKVTIQAFIAACVNYAKKLCA